MNREPLEETYFKWLVAQVANVRLKSPRLAYWNLMRQLFVTEFTWRVRNDDNRVVDGKELRSLFLSEHPNPDATPAWLEQGCSFLEMLIALSGRLTFQTEGASPADWFWHLLGNVNIVVTDEEYANLRMEVYVGQVLDMINQRTYEPNGKGGLFPLNHAKTDQTKAEIWSQMNYYLIERS